MLLGILLCAPALAQANSAGTISIREAPLADPPSFDDLLGLRQLGAELGLPQMTVFALAENGEGYLLAGTQDGLARWDGRRFERIELLRGSRSWVTQLLLDAARNWVGTDRDGLFLIDDDGIRRVLDTQGQPLRSVEAIARARAGGVWVGTPQGLYLCDSAACRLQAGSEGMQVSEIAESTAAATEGLWIGTNEDGVHRFALDQDGQLGARLLHLSREHGLPNAVVRALLVDRGGRVWIGTGRGLVRFDGESMLRWRETGRGPLGGVFDLLEMADGSVYAALWGEGLAHIRADDGYRLFGVADGLPDGHLYRLLRTGSADDPILWIGTAAAGLLRREEGRWRSFDERHGLPQRVVVGVGEMRFADGVETLWTGTLGGLVRWRDGRWESFLPEAYRQHAVYDLLRDPAGRLWYASNRGLLRQDGESWRAFSVDRDELPGIAVERLLWVDGRLWVGTRHGLAIVDEDRVQPLPPGLQPLARESIRDLLMTPPGPTSRRILIATARNVWVSDGAQLHSVPDACVPLDAIYGLYAQGTEVWIATRLGAIRLDWPGGAARCVAVEEGGAPGGSVFAMTASRSGDMFLFGYDGARQVAVSDGVASLRRHGPEDGLPTWEFNRAAHTDRYGRIWGATVNGLAVHDPRHQVRSVPGAILRLHALVDGVALEAPARLPANHRELRFSVRLLSFRQEHRIRYRSRLLGLDEGDGAWDRDGDRHYPRLPTGAYRFEVEAMDAAGVRHGPIGFDLLVEAPWWRRGSMLALYAALLLATGLGLGRMRARALLAQTQRLESLVAARTRELERVSRTDPLTGAWNRRHFHASIADWQAQGALAVLLIDIDHFKQINDCHGHAVGDQVLVAVAQRLQSVDPRLGELIRWGGEEFLLLFRAASTDEGDPDVRMLAARALAAVAAEPVMCHAGSLEVRCSIGCTLSRSEAIDRAIARADEALYRAKSGGRNRVETG